MNNHYDYHNDPEILRRAEIYDRSHPALYQQFFDETSTDVIPFYDEDLIRSIMALPSLDDYNSVEQSIMLYRILLLYIFKHNRTPMEGMTYDWGEVLRGLHVRLFNSYAQAITAKYDHTNDYQTIIHCLETWVNVTFDILCESLVETPFPVEQSDYHDNLDLCRQSLGVVLAQYQEILSGFQFGNYVPASGIILYNFWKDDYEILTEKKNKYSASTEEEGQMTSQLHNSLLFEKTIRDFVYRAVDLANQAEPRESYLDEPKRMLSNLFSAYTKLLRIKGVKDSGPLMSAVRHWQFLTQKVIFKVTEVERQSYRMSQYPPGSVVHSQVFRLSPENRKKYDAIVELRNKCNLWVEYVCKEYGDRVEHGDMRFPWAEDLAGLNIDYSGLYRIFISEGPHHYIYGISENVFRDAIESAEINVLMDHLAIPGKDSSRENAKEPTRDMSKAAIRYLVQAIGRQVHEWYKAAASTMLDSKGKPYTITAFQSLHPTEETARMSELLLDYMKIKPVRPYRRKK